MVGEGTGYWGKVEGSRWSWWVGGLVVRIYELENGLKTTPKKMPKHVAEIAYARASIRNLIELSEDEDVSELEQAISLLDRAQDLCLLKIDGSLPD